MSALLVEHFVPLMFGGLLLVLLSGLPVAFGLAATGLGFGLLGIGLELFPPALFQALPLRIFGIMQNETLLAIPFFTLMGLVLERSGLAEDLLDTVGQVFGPLRGGLAVAVVLVGALLAATTGVMAAAVISMGLISLPIMLRHGYHRPLAAGVIAASGTLAQAIPPSLVLIVLADQLGRSVGQLYAGALGPGLLLVASYLVFIALMAWLKPQWLPALPPEARVHREASGRSGHRSLGLLLALCAAAGWAWARVHEAWVNAWLQRSTPAPGDEVLISALAVAAALAFVLATLNRALGLGALSKLAEQVTFVLIPPLLLIFLVLGTIFLGLATPTEGGALGALGALLMAATRRRLGRSSLREALDRTAELSCFVLFILIGSTVFSFTFNAADGHLWVEQLFAGLPGGAWGFLLVVNLLVFGLGMFIDFFEIAFIVVPLLLPTAEKLLPALLPGLPPEAVMVWFGVMLAMNLQTSFLTPPFGFALFYLRSVAPAAPWRDAASGRTLEGLSTAQIYRGTLPFIGLQLAVVAALVVWPGLVTDGLDDAAASASPAVQTEGPRAEPLRLRPGASVFDLSPDPDRPFEPPPVPPEALDAELAAREAEALRALQQPAPAAAPR
ncbi:TRAP transporter large permease [Aquariibacter albus]|uniref:TRAP transporter large permease subunit n=1 Tax=Aquariibacter albus TaxID=2759899 RepID=A0A839HNL3_9BURK|nr:TRAP transporter large permease subunit [Aquariibacter albus]MBB1161188.1 TRAP transporter large permease subunit [Aquariibacter albus]